MRGQQFAEPADAVAEDCRGIFSRGVENIVVEHEDAVFQARHDRLHQDRVVIPGNPVDIFVQGGLAVHGLREIATRSLQRLDEGRRAQHSEIFQRIAAFMPGRAVRAVSLVQEKIMPAKRRNAGSFEKDVGKILV